MLTANSDDLDKIVGLEVGADDYVTKPYNPRELLARVKAVLRRRAAGGGEAPATMGREVQMGKCRLNLDTRKLFEADGGEVPLTAMEFDLLRTFAEHPRRVLSRDQLLDLAHSKEMEPFDRSIDTRIARIRRKIEPDPSKPDCIRTVRGAGYVFNPDCGEPSSPPWKGGAGGGLRRGEASLHCGLRSFGRLRRTHPQPLPSMEGRRA